MNQKLIQIVRKLKGSLLGIGLDSQILDVIEKNDNIDNCFIMSDRHKLDKKFDFFGDGKDKKVNIKKIRKIFKKKSLDTIICNYQSIKPFLRRFTSNSIYINKRKLYIYGQIDDDDTEKIKKRYSRYQSQVEVIKAKTYTIIEVNNENINTSFFKDKIYLILDLLNDVIDILTTILVG